MRTKTVEYQSQVYVDSQVWFWAFSVQAECGVEGPGSRGTLSALGSRDHHPCTADEEAKGPLVQDHATGLPLGIQTWAVASKVSKCAWREGV